MSRSMRRDERTESMLAMARHLAGNGHRLQMIEALLEANGFPEAYALIDRPDIQDELLQVADRARRGEPAEEGDGTAVRR